MVSGITKRGPSRTHGEGTSGRGASAAVAGAATPATSAARSGARPRPRAGSGTWAFGSSEFRTDREPSPRERSEPQHQPARLGMGRKRCQDSFLGLPRGRRVDWRFRCREIACIQFSSPKGEPRLTLLRTALSSAAVSGLLTRSVQRGGPVRPARRFVRRAGRPTKSETHRRKLLMPPSSVGCNTKCQWLGIAGKPESGSRNASVPRRGSTRGLRSPPVCGKWSTGHCLGSRRDKSRPLRLHVLVFPSR